MQNTCEHADHSRTTDRWPGLDYATWPKDVYILAKALCGPDRGTLDSVPSFLRPYVAGECDASGRLRHQLGLPWSPMLYAKFQLAYDRDAPIPWRGICSAQGIVDHFEREGGEAEEKGHESVPEPEVPHSDLYFIASESGPIKIGISVNVEKRLKQLQTSHPYPLKVLAVVKAAGMQEFAYHERFAAHRLHGEWFARHPDILAEINRLNGPETALARCPALHSEGNFRHG